MALTSIGMVFLDYSTASVVLNNTVVITRHTGETTEGEAYKSFRKRENEEDRDSEEQDGAVPASDLGTGRPIRTEDTALVSAFPAGCLATNAFSELVLLSGH